MKEAAVRADGSAHIGYFDLIDVERMSNIPAKEYGGSVVGSCYVTKQSRHPY